MCMKCINDDAVNVYNIMTGLYISSSTNWPVVMSLVYIADSALLPVFIIPCTCVHVYLCIIVLMEATHGTVET